MSTCADPTGDRPVEEQRPSRPLVVAANRLPVMRSADGDWEPSPGGLVRALLPMLRRSGGSWVGWTGDVDDDPAPFSVDGVELHPVAISQEEHDDYYEGFANDSLWPLYHDAVRDSTFRAVQWDAYVAVNQRFADRLAEVAPPDAVIWVHDYHLQLVPSMVRALRPDATIGFFLHIPFPPFELFSRLPWRSEIIDGLLGADLVGFQRQVGASNFVTIADQLHDVTVHETASETARQAGREYALTTPDGHVTTVGVFPISIDVGEVDDLAAQRNVRRASSEVRTRLGNPEVILLGVDRLDYTKGIGLRMRAFESLLDDGLLHADRCVMIQVATPTREAVEHYRNERHEVERLVGEINGRHARLGQPVLHYLYRSLPLADLVALYLACDVMLVTPLGDGMNLVAKEYVAAPARRERRAGAVGVRRRRRRVDRRRARQPPRRPGTARGDHDRRRDAPRRAHGAHAGAARHRRPQRRAGLGRALLRRARGAPPVTLSTLPFADPAALAADSAALERPLLVGLDVDGVLAPIVGHPADAALVPGTIDVLVALSHHGPVGIVSGRALGDLARFGFPEAVMVAGSHGDERRGHPLTALTAEESTRLDRLRDLTERAARAAGPGAWVESKPTSVVLHVRGADPGRSVPVAQELARTAMRIGGTDVKRGHSVVELGARPASKAAAIADMRAESEARAVVFVGDDLTDEDVFASLGSGDLGVHVGVGPTAAGRRLRDPAAVHQLLRHLVASL